MRGLYSNMILLFLSAGLLSACSKATEYGSDGNKAPMDQARKQSPEPLASGGGGGEHSVGEANTPATSDITTAAKKLSVLLSVLADSVLSEKAMSNRDISGSQDFLTSLKAFHQAILRLAKLDSRNSDLRQTLERYETTVLKPCLITGDPCSALKHVARDAGNYSAVIMVVNQVLKPAPPVAWKYLLFSLDFALFPQSEEFSNYAFRMTEDHLHELAAASTRQAPAWSEMKSLVNQLVLASLQNGKSVPSFLDRVDVWSEDQGQDLTHLVLREALWPLLIRDYALRDGQPTPSFQKYVDRSLAQFTHETVDYLQANPRFARVYQTLNLKDPGQKDSQRLTLFILDQVFLGKLNVDDAYRLLNSANPSVDTLIATAEDYVRLKFTRLSLESQVRLKDNLGPTADYHTLLDLRTNLQKSEPLVREWAAFQQHITQLKTVVESRLTSGMSAETSRKMGALFDRLDRNIKWSVIYPNMLPVLYFISKANFSDSFQFLWWSFELNSDSIFSSLFGGELSSWFNFTNVTADNDRLSGPEVLLAFRNAVNTELFQTWGIMPSDFILAASDRLLTRTSVLFEDGATAINHDLLQERIDHKNNRSTFMRATDLCRGDKSVHETIELKELTSRLDPFEIDLLGGMTGMASSTASPYNTYFRMPIRESSRVASLAWFVDEAYTDDFYLIGQVTKLADIYKDYLRKYGQTDPKMAQVDAKLDKIRARAKIVFGLIHKVLNRFEPCVLDRIQNGRARELAVMRYERIYQRDWFKRMQMIVNDPTKLEAINEKNRRYYARIDYKTTDGVTKTGNGFAFLYSKGDFLLRVKEYLQNGWTDDAGNVYPPLAPGIEITMPISLLADRNEPTTFSYEYEYAEFLANVMTMAIVYTPGMTEGDFLLQAAKAFYEPSETSQIAHKGNLKQFVSWHSLSSEGGYGNYQSTRMITKAALFKFGPMDIYDFEKAGCDPKMDGAQLEANCLKRVEVTAEDLYKGQIDMLNILNMSPEFVDYLKPTGTSGLFTYDTVGNNLVFSHLNGKVLGVMDNYRYVLSHQIMMPGMSWPGEINERGGPMQRPGYLDHAMDYYQHVASQGEPFLNPIAELNGGIEELYTDYVRREFQPLMAIEKVAAAHPDPVRVKYNVYDKAVKLPELTDYSQPAEVTIRDFNLKTDSVFLKATQ